MPTKKNVATQEKRGLFLRFAKATANAAGSPPAFLLASGAIVLWAISGPLFGYSDTWQLVINTSTTIITFLMVFLIQNTQNRDSRALQLKLDELLRVSDGAHNMLLDLEELSDEELKAICKKYLALAELARTQMRNGQGDTDCPTVALDEAPAGKKKAAPLKSRLRKKVSRKKA
ncbi:MAG: low affinity iron permease family protein [Pseudomonadota bacterium]